MSTVRPLAEYGWARRALAALLVLALLAPVFGWAASEVGYSEPLENAAHQTGATDDAQTINSGLLPDYTVPGLGFGLGTLGSALVGIVVTLALAVGFARVFG